LALESGGGGGSNESSSAHGRRRLLTASVSASPLTSSSAISSSVLVIAIIGGAVGAFALMALGIVAYLIVSKAQFSSVQPPGKVLSYIVVLFYAERDGEGAMALTHACKQPPCSHWEQVALKSESAEIYAQGLAGSHQSVRVLRALCVCMQIQCDPNFEVLSSLFAHPPLHEQNQPSPSMIRLAILPMRRHAKSVRDYYSDRL